MADVTISNNIFPSISNTLGSIMTTESILRWKDPYTHYNIGTTWTRDCAAWDLSRCIEKELEESKVNPEFMKKVFNTKEVKMFTAIRMWTNGAYTTVKWDDGTKTTVKAENEETATEYCGFAAAFLKKHFGSTQKAINAMEKAKDKAEEPARKRKEYAEHCKKVKEANRKAKEARREERVKDAMEHFAIEQEARKRMTKED